MYKYLLVIFIILAACQSPLEERQTLPNVVFILADDIGPGDIGYYHQKRTGNSSVIPTPNLDALLKSGIHFTDAHTVSALCAPTRYSVMTGNYTFRCRKQWGVWGSCDSTAIGKDQPTVAQMMKKAGYQTAFFGKWHLGGDWKIKGSEKIYRGAGTGDETTDFSEMVNSSPNHLGFDYSFMLPAGIQNNPFAYYENARWMPLSHDSEIIINPLLHGGFHSRKHPRFADSHFVTSEAGRMLSEKAIKYIDRQTQEYSGQPFFIYYCSQAVHVPHEPPATFNKQPVAGTTLSAHGDMIRELDLQVGALIKTLKKNNVYENTLFIFSSDNGGLNISETEATGHDSSHGFRGSKTWIYEGGHRVPFIASWPGKIEPGSESNEPVMVHDLAATLLAVTNQEHASDQAIDSYNLLPLLMNEKNAKGRKIIFSQGSGNRGTLAIRKDAWKLIIQSDRDSSAMCVPRELYNLRENINEAEDQNLIHQPEQQKKIKELVELYQKIRNSEQREEDLF